jgi:hypothetical protein
MLRTISESLQETLEEDYDFITLNGSEFVENETPLGKFLQPTVSSFQ